MYTRAGSVVVGRTWGDPRLLVVLGLGAAILLVATVLGVLLHYGVLWLRGLVSGAHIPYLQILRMRLRGVVPALIVNNCIKAARAGRPIRWQPLVEHELNEGNVRNVVAALIAASDWDIALTEAQARALDLAGRDVLAEVERARVRREMGYVDPGTGQRGLVLKTADGQRIAAHVRVQYRHAPPGMLQGPGVQHVLDQVVHAVRQQAAHRPLRQPVSGYLAEISQSVLSMHLDAGSSCDILSVTVEEKNMAAGQ